VSNVFLERAATAGLAEAQYELAQQCVPPH
jgi:hypothetical protein